MQYDNFAKGPYVSDGFDRDGAANINFTAALSGQSSGYFWDIYPNQRDSHWAFDILNVNQATQGVPEPTSLLLLGLGLMGLAGVRRFKS